MNDQPLDPSSIIHKMSSLTSQKQSLRANFSNNRVQLILGDYWGEISVIKGIQWGKKKRKKKKNGEEVPNRSSLHLFAIDTRSFKSIPWPPIIVGFAAPSPPLPPIISAVSAISFLRFRTVVLDRFRVKQTDSRAYIGDPRLRRGYVFRAVAILVVAISRTDPHASESLFPAIHRGALPLSSNEFDSTDSITVPQFAFDSTHGYDVSCLHFQTPRYSRRYDSFRYSTSRDVASGILLR